MTGDREGGVTWGGTLPVTWTPAFSIYSGDSVAGTLAAAVATVGSNSPGTGTVTSTFSTATNRIITVVQVTATRTPEYVRAQAATSTFASQSAAFSSFTVTPNPSSLILAAITTQDAGSGGVGLTAGNGYSLVNESAIATDRVLNVISKPPPIELPTWNSGTTTEPSAIGLVEILAS